MTAPLDSLPKVWRAARHPYTALFVVAVISRLIFFYLGSVQNGSASALAVVFPDGQQYLNSARAIASSFSWSTTGVEVFGPGYPALLALWGTLTSLHPAWLLLSQLLAASAGALLLSHLIFRLTGDRATAVVAGFVHALSLSAIGLSCALLSDALCLLVLVAGLVQLEQAAREDSFRRACVAGFGLGFAVLMRSASLVAVLLLPFLVLHHPQARRGPVWAAVWRSRRVLLATAALMLALPVCWAVRNRVVHGAAYVSKAGAIAQIRMAAAFQTRIDGTDTPAGVAAITDSISTQVATSAEPERTFFDLASEHFWKRVKAHPKAALTSYWHSMDQATHTDWGPLIVQLPAWEAPYSEALHWSRRYPLRYRTLMFTCVGLLILAATRRYRLAFTLAFIYVLFALTAGLSLWQGNRIFYPGQIAWTALVAVVLVTTSRGVPRLVRHVSRTRSIRRPTPEDSPAAEGAV